METTTNPEALVGKLFDVVGMAKRHNGRYVIKSYNEKANWYVFSRLDRHGRERTGTSPAAHDTNCKLWNAAQIAAKVAAGILVEVQS